MARLRTLFLLAGALGCWPAVGFAQTGEVTPAGVPALPPGMARSTGAVPTAPAIPMPPVPSAVAAVPGRVSIADRPGGTLMAQAAPPAMMPGSPMSAAQPSQGMMPAPVSTTAFAGGCGPADCGAPAFCPMPPPGVDPCGTISPATGPSGVLVNGEIMFFRARRNDPAVLYTTNAAPNPLGGNTQTSSLANYDTTTSIGFRVGAGYLDCSGYHFLANYTRYKDTVANQTILSPVGAAVAAPVVFVGPGLVGAGVLGAANPGDLNMSWEFDYQTVDLMFGTVISPATCLDLIFSAGGRLANIDQFYRTQIDSTPYLVDAGGIINERFDLRIRGAGPRFGTEARFYPLKPVTLYGRAHTTLLLAHRDENSLTQAIGGGVTNIVNANYQREEIMPMVELAAGIDVSLFNGKLLVGGGYELNYIFEAGSSSAEKSILNTAPSRRVNLTLDGAVVHVTYLW